MKKSESMQVYLSNLAVLNVKLHNLHWNVVGINFVALHNFTEILYDDVFAQYDDVAEQLKMSGIVPFSTLKEYLVHATINEIEAKAFTTSEVLSILIEDLSRMKDLALSIRDLADEVKDPTAVAFFEDQLAKFNKHLWFLAAMQQ